MIRSNIRAFQHIMSSSTAKLKLWTAGTPNGHKPSILLEELKDAYGLEYDFHGLSFKENEQKQEWFLKVFESAAILLWLIKKYDPEHKFSFSDEREASDADSWLAWGIGGLGPMQGQSNHFYRYAPERIPYAIDRYLNETKRLYSVLDDRLSGKRENGFALGTDGKSADDAAKGEEREYLVGAGKGKYSFVDISLWPWVRSHAWAGVQTLDAYPHLKRWFDAIAQRPAVKRGVDVPEKSKYNPNATPEEQDKIAAEARKWILGGK